MKPPSCCKSSCFLSMEFVGSLYSIGIRSLGRTSAMGSRKISNRAQHVNVKSSATRRSIVSSDSNPFKHVMTLYSTTPQALGTIALDFLIRIQFRKTAEQRTGTIRHWYWTHSRGAQFTEVLNRRRTPWGSADHCETPFVYKTIAKDNLADARALQTFHSIRIKD